MTATVTLSYLAQGFDWSASYVAQMHETKKEMGLFAWLTVINGGAQSFRNARLQVVAGQPNKEENAEPPQAAPPSLSLQCWPMDNTSTHDRWGLANFAAPPPPVMMEAMSDIIVTARRRAETLQSVGLAVAAIQAEQEDLGDLKLYRVPERVTVAAQSQKQVAMIQQSEVRYEQIYRVVADNLGNEPRPLPIQIRTKNSKDKALACRCRPDRLPCLSLWAARCC